jgi:hypothetical protein
MGFEWCNLEEYEERKSREEEEAKKVAKLEQRDALKKILDEQVRYRKEK